MSKRQSKKLSQKPAEKTKASRPSLEGKTAPALSLPSSEGGRVSLKQHLGKDLVVLYFYPRDLTPGCTIEACDFSDRLQELRAAGAVVYGVSRDTLELHEKFKAKHGLKFPLLSDEDGDVCKRFGVWREKNLYGKKIMGIVRSTFIIDREGVVRKVWDPVRVAGHADEVLSAVKSLS